MSMSDKYSEQRRPYERSSVREKLTEIKKEKVSISIGFNPMILLLFLTLVIGCENKGDRPVLGDVGTEIAIDGSCKVNFWPEALKDATSLTIGIWFSSGGDQESVKIDIIDANRELIANKSLVCEIKKPLIGVGLEAETLISLGHSNEDGKGAGSGKSPVLHFNYPGTAPTNWGQSRTAPTKGRYVLQSIGSREVSNFNEAVKHCTWILYFEIK